MEKLFRNINTTNKIMLIVPSPPTPLLLSHHQFTHTKPRIVSTFAAKSNGFSINSIFSGCKVCGGKNAIECPGCKGTGKNKKNGNIFERWKCYDCQGFGMKSCPGCGKGGLTPEQRGER
ncbi:uncharacterized protein [Euphorbia lathyris]|uniref:uncharacterized protein n=1 Tax=Euphorbia lathyris TaxID=212925 RepID=UPI0033142BCF